MKPVKNLLAERSSSQMIIRMICMAVLLYMPVASAAIVPNLATMVENLSKTIPNLMQLVTAFAYVAGMFLIFKGILQLKEYGESRTMMSHNQSLKGPLIFLGVGAALLYLPSSVQVGLSTFWQTTVPYAYVPQTSDPWSDLIQDCFLIVQFLGTFAFIRGLLILTQLGGHSGSHPGTLTKGLAHIIGGILCINLYQFVQMVLNTLALGQV